MLRAGLGTFAVANFRLLAATSSTQLHLRTLWATRAYSTDTKGQLNATHSQFLAEAPARADWNKNSPNGNAAYLKEQEDELEGVTETRGKISPTSSHLFKLILPLGSLKKNFEARDGAAPKTPPTVVLLHPSQPLSHVARLIMASLAPSTPTISFRSMSRGGQAFQWSDSTDVGDFIRDAAKSAEFTICFQYPADKSQKEYLPAADQAEERMIPVAASSDHGIDEKLLAVTVPTFADRTRFMRRRLKLVETRLEEMEGLKIQCDKEAHRGVKRMAMAGFGMLVVYWGTVARLTFWDYGWDFMEPVTYLSGLSTVILGYLWFLYQGREVSYTSILARSISARREALYKARGFDIERWIDFVGEKKTLKAEISRIARDYEGDEDKAPKDEKKKDEKVEKDNSGSNSDSALPPTEEKSPTSKVVEEETLKAIKEGKLGNEESKDQDSKH
ncbi:hypothetical protein CPB83DRAFT_850623 [Crepidotus variabilis]|uniref:Calcium uniporter protein, mitochondrial n=1 Tax=Crepidotus variabilis TaxID=179855 RepID=A0A9P6EK96_9AGAR|nr:hypothetical protein CPB83DRAFT_850623 [Crepidotus variabilis]